MLQLIKKMFSNTELVDYKSLVQNGSQIIDVRTPREYQSGHLQSSKNIPLQELSNKLGTLNKNNTYIVCCASGARSGSAKRMMKSAGFENVHNGGGWMQLQGKIHN